MVNNNELKKLIESDFYRHYSGSKPQVLWRIRNVALYCTKLKPYPISTV